MTIRTKTSRSGTARAAAAGLVLTGLLMSACATPTPGPDGNYARPIGSAPVTPNPTPYSTALSCLANYAAQQGLVAPRIAVGRLSDLTGRLDENGGRTVTQGGALMAMSALGKAGIPLVERYETEVSKLEYQLADNRLISDQPPVPGARRDYRPVFAGDMSGSNYFVTGGITELNTNIRGSSAGVGASKDDGAVKVGGVEGKIYVMNIGLDIRLVDTRSLDVVHIVSYQKQIIGHRIGGDLFSFFGGNVISLSAETGGDEPIHLAVRSLVERAVVEMVSRLYRLPSPSPCLNPAFDPLSGTIVSEQAVPYAAALPVAYERPPQAFAPAPQMQGPVYGPAVQQYAPAAPAQGWSGSAYGPALPAPAYYGRY